MKFLEKVRAFFYPERCVSCGKMVDAPGFCEKCAGEVIPAPCKSQVECSFGCCDLFSLYLYTGSARRALINMKFNRRPKSSEYFGRELAKRIAADCRTGFDAICFVPMTSAGVKKRGYNQAELIAKAVSEETGIPIFAAGLVKRCENKAQHKLNAAERRLNVKGVFSVWDDVAGKRILLIDDIKTTGATLGECCDMLMLAGAKSVDCGVVGEGKGISSTNRH